MEHSREAYNSSKKRNQETLLRIQALENEVLRLEQEIRDKKKRANYVRLYHDRCDRLAQRQRAYHAIMPSPLPWTIDKRQTPRLDDTLKILEKHITIDPQDIADLLSKNLITTLAQRVSQLEVPSETLTRPKPRDDPSDDIQQAIQDRQRETELIYQQCDTLQTRVHQLQKELRTRIGRLYSDERVQSAYLKSIRTEAESHSVAAQRKALEDQVNSLQADALMDGSTKATHTIEDIVSEVEEKQRKVQEMMAVSRAGARRLEEQRQKYDKEETERRRVLLEQLDQGCKKLRGSIKRKSDLFHRLPLTPGSGLDGRRDGTRLEQIKGALHPYLRLSQYGVLEVLGDVLTRVNASHPPEPGLRETFEALAARWQQDLEQNSIDFNEPDPNEDAVDTLIKAIKILQSKSAAEWIQVLALLIGNIVAHSKREQAAFVAKQEAQLASKLRTLKQADREVLSIIDAIEER
ncbi:hypothetical protein BJV82DRAFT_584833 [Fennellomyces sp. T-0311]|nr:hypothetical protein BJV82DRAFT_584833 [Fennellomyces sp. T-0311]